MKHLLRTLVLTMVLCMVMSNAMAAPLTAAEITNPDTDTIIKLDHGLPTPELPLVSEPITLTVMICEKPIMATLMTCGFLNK